MINDNTHAYNIPTLLQVALTVSTMHFLFHADDNKLYSAVHSVQNDYI